MINVLFIFVLIFISVWLILIIQEMLDLFFG